VTAGLLRTAITSTWEIRKRTMDVSVVGSQSAIRKIIGIGLAKMFTMRYN
jgi:hypothetical protein